jgi:hypothetical protein
MIFTASGRNILYRPSYIAIYGKYRFILYEFCDTGFKSHKAHRCANSLLCFNTVLYR